jgi:hypothetical protein
MRLYAKGRSEVSASFVLLPSDLLPVSFPQLPMIAPMNPPMRNPMLVLLRRTFPSTGGQDVVVAFITVVPGDPHVAPVRRRTPVLVNRRFSVWVTGGSAVAMESTLPGRWQRNLVRAPKQLLRSKKSF